LPIAASRSHAAISQPPFSLIYDELSWPISPQHFRRRRPLPADADYDLFDYAIDELRI